MYFFSAKDIRILCIESAKTVNEMTLTELVKLTMLRTTGPRKANQKSPNLSTLSDMAECLPNVSIHQTQMVEFTDVIRYYCILLNFLLISTLSS